MTTRIIRRTFTPVSSDALSLRDMMDRLVESAFVSPDHWPTEWAPTAGGPALDILEKPESYIVRAALPGWKPDDVDITFEDGVLTMKGEVNENTEQNDENTRWHRREIRHVSFARSITLPTQVEPDKANASFENGVLTLTLPKAEAVKPKQIKIQAQ